MYSQSTLIQYQIEVPKAVILVGVFTEVLLSLMYHSRCYYYLAIIYSGLRLCV